VNPAPAPSGPSTFLNAARRGRDLEVLAGGEQVDVLVIGGGVTGAGVALDAASRGLRVALAERRDLANGTSRWSSKLAHGGLRYLAQGQFGVAWESARERDTLATVTAPHLIRPLPQLIPVLRGEGGRAAALMEVGIRMGDAMRALSGTSRRLLAPMRRVGGAEACLWAPALAARRVSSAILYWDAQLEDDARLVVALARTAAAHGARILTYCEVTRLTGTGAEARDVRSGESFELRALQVVNATGVWADRLVGGIELRPSRGSHLLVPAARLRHPRAMLNVPDPEHFGRFVFAIPRQDGLALVGLTDEPFTGSEIPDAPEVSDSEESYLLRSLSRALEVPLGPEDVVGRFAGLRPLLAGGAERTRDLSRRHAVLSDPDSGAVSVVGGKLTTYRRMAEDTVDAVAGRLGRRVAPCRTRRLRLVGAEPRPHPELPAGLVRRFGAEAAELVELAEGRPELLEPVVEGTDVLGVEWLAAVEREGALSLDDVLDRRTRLGLVPVRRAAALEAADRLLPELAGTLV
jgi:glycerol-3-phosphate dehydrogenase